MYFIIPAISTNNKGHRFSVAFFIGGFGVEFKPLRVH